MIGPRLQPSGVPIDVSDWPTHEDFEGVYTEGTRAKRLLVCPSPAPHDFLIGGHRYLFKKSVARYPDQFWTEVMASRVGLLAGVPVPPAFAACDRNTGECAALIEWFYGYPGMLRRRFVRGGDFMVRLIPGYDIKRGEQHNFAAIRTIALNFTQSLSMGDWESHWAKVFAFDALIGNVDRHQDNWGVLLEFTGEGPVRGYWAPAYDNGTSLGHNLFEPRLVAMTGSKDQLDRFLGNGVHHARWELGDPKRLSHGDFLVRLCQAHPDMKPAMLSCLRFSDSALDEWLLPLTELEVAVPLSLVRVRFVIKMLSHRRDNLRERIENLP